MKLSEILVNERAKTLSSEDMKLIKGSGCGYSRPWTDPTVHCASSAAEAEAAAGDNGWWCCGCSQASHC